MQAPVTVRDTTGFAIKDPADIAVYKFDWNLHYLAVGVEIDTFSFTVTCLRGENTTPLVANTDSPLGLQSGNRTIKVRLTGGTLRSAYRIDNQIVTTETPSRTIQRSVTVLIEEL